MKLGLEALRNANDQELNRDAVEVSVIDAEGYRVLDRAEATSKSTVSNHSRSEQIHGQPRRSRLGEI